MGTRDELERLARFVVDAGIEPQVDSVRPLADARAGLRADGAGRGLRARSSSRSDPSSTVWDRTPRTGTVTYRAVT